MIAPGDPQLRNIGEPGGRGLILYDGVCVLCSGWVRFVASRDEARLFLFTPIQSEYGRALALKHHIDPDNPQSNAVLVDGTVNLRSDSAIAALSRLPRYGWVRAFRIVPKPVTATSRPTSRSASPTPRPTTTPPSGASRKRVRAWRPTAANASP